MNRGFSSALLLTASLLLFTGCGSSNTSPADASITPLSSPSEPSMGPETSPNTKTLSPSLTPAPSSPSGIASANPTGNSTSNGKSIAEQVVAKPDSITVLVNKQYALPESYIPKDLVYPNVPFVFKEQTEKRKMRKEAAKALEDLFSGAKKDGISLLGVSAYRSHETQKALFNNYVKKDGEQKARTYSAVPGHSEHETGLAIDVTGGDGKCAAEDCFADTKEAAWLQKHAAEYGFIIRFLKGKEAITGYQYEPWHIRYVGTEAAKEMASKGIALEEYMNAVPVAK